MNWTGKSILFNLLLKSFLLNIGKLFVLLELEEFWKMILKSLEALNKRNLSNKFSNWFSYQ